MARIISLGAALQNIYLIDHDDLASTNIGESAILGKVLVGSEVEIDRISYGVGGGGLNAAISFARHNHETILISSIGRDTTANTILRTLDDENIDSSYLNLIPRQVTGTSVILLDSKSGERTILTNTGASRTFSDFDEDDIDLIDPDWLYASTLYGDYDTLERFFKKAHKNHTKVMFAPGKKELEDTKKFTSLLKNVDVLIVNKNEAAKIVPGTILAELLPHLNNYVETVIITDGQMGGIASNRAETYRFGVYEDVKVKDITGAGDAFGSGFLAHFAAGKSFKSSLAFASANSATIIAKVGANNGIMTGKENLHPMPIQKI